MSWRDEKADYLQRSRDFSFLNDDDRGSRDTPRSKKVIDERAPDNQEARDRLLRLKALEKQRADKQRKQYLESPSPEGEDRYERRDMERNPGPSGSKRPPVKDNFGSFFGKGGKVVAKRVVDEKRARDIAAREARSAEAEKAAKARAVTRNGSSIRPPSRPVAKPKPVNPVTVKAQKLKDNRDYSFLFSNETPSKPEGRDSRAEPSKASKGVRDSSQGLTKQKPVNAPSQKAKPASNGGSRPQVSASGQSRKAGASTSTSRQGSDRDPRYENERRADKDSRLASGGRAERDTRESRYDSERRPERTMPSSRVGSASKGALDERPSPRGVSSKLPLASDRAKRDAQERAKVLVPKATNHDRAVSRESLSSKPPKVSQTSGQRMSQSSNGAVRERIVQKSTAERRALSQSAEKSPVTRGMAPSSAGTKRKMVGEPAKRASLNAKSNDGRRVERPRDSDSDPDSDLRKLVAGRPRPGASGKIAPASANGLKRKASDEVRKTPLGAPARRPLAEQHMRRKPGGNEPLRRNSSDELRRRASDEPMRIRPASATVKKRVQRLSDSEYESDGDDEGPVRASGVSGIIQKIFRYDPHKYVGLDDGDDKNMVTSYQHIQAEEKRSARLAREEDEREQALIEEEERKERLRKLKRQKAR